MAPLCILLCTPAKAIFKIHQSFHCHRNCHATFLYYCRVHLECANRRKVDLQCSIFRIHCKEHCFVIKLEDESFYLLCNNIKTVVKKMISGRINDTTIFLTHIPGKECHKNYKVTSKYIYIYMLKTQSN